LPLGAARTTITNTRSNRSCPVEAPDFASLFGRRGLLKSEANIVPLIPSPNNCPVDERRRHGRHTPSSIMYVTLGSDNGGILLNLGVGGLAFQAASKLNQDQTLALQFKLAGTRETIQAEGQVAWLGHTHKEAGIRFTHLPASVGQIIAEWIAHQEETPNAAGKPAAKPARAKHANSVAPEAIPLAGVPGTAPKLPAAPATSSGESREEYSSGAQKNAPPVGAVVAQPQNPGNVFINPPAQSVPAELLHWAVQQQDLQVTRPAAKSGQRETPGPSEPTDRLDLNKLFQSFLKRVVGISIRDDQPSPATSSDGVQKPFFLSEVRGTWYWNGDGSSRQKIIRDCAVGEELHLIPELDRFGVLAVKICRANGEQLGFWDEDREITKSLSCARHYRVTIHEIYAFKEDAQKRGVKLRIDVFD
jgi:hypothetical protein